MNNFKNFFIKNNHLRIFNISAHQLRGKSFFDSIFKYRKKFFFTKKKNQKIKSISMQFMQSFFWEDFFELEKNIYFNTV